MIRLRQLSLGDIYTFDHNCPRCKKEIKNINIDLAKLSVTDVPLEVASQADHVMTLPRSNDVVRWRFTRGEDETLIQEMMNEHKAEFISVMIYRRIVSVEVFDKTTGTLGSPVKPPGGLLYLKRMSSADRRHLQNQFQTVEGGIDTDIQVTCDNCGTEFETKINLSGQGSFFFPSATPSPKNSTSAPSPNVGGGALTSRIESDSPSDDA